MKMFNAILQYVRSWFPEDEISANQGSRKRRGSDLYYKSPKQRKILSSMTNNIIRDEIFPRRFRSPLSSTSRVLVIDDDDDDDVVPVSKPIDIKIPRKPSENRKLNGDDVSFLKSIKSTTEKKLDAKKGGFEYITRFARSLDSPNKFKRMNTSKNSSRMRSPISSSPLLDYSVRLEDKKKYEMLLENVALQNTFNDSISSSVYGTPLVSPNRSRRLVELARSPKEKCIEVIDLTENKRKLSTKDRVIKILDDFESVEDSDSDVEILPTPPSPKPDIKVAPINSLKTVVDTSKPTQLKWLDELTKNHEQYVVDKSKEIRAYEEKLHTLSEINRDLLIKSLSQKVKNSLAIKDSILPEIEIEEDTVLPQLTDDQLRMVKRALSGDPNEVLSKKFSLNLNRADIRTLAGLNWLNDNVINFYMNLIIERSNDSKWPKTYCMNTFFYPKLAKTGADSLKRWTRKVDLFSCEFICVPIHLGMHWCMAIINLKEKSIKYYDSMGKSNNNCLNALKDYLEFEHMDKKGQPYSTKDFVLENVKNIPQQMNGSDCGMFSCMFAEYATRKAKFTFQQEDMPYFRKKMVVEILMGQLLIQ